MVIKKDGMPFDIPTHLKQLTLDEKASLCSGHNMWRTKAIERLDIPAITFADGPNGLRKQPGEGDNLGLTISLPSTCFPSASTMANAWDPDLLYEIGVALGKEGRAAGVDVLLGPGINIKRNPLCGRNFEYFSEDPLLTGTLAVAFIQGVQSQGVGASLKHFAVNNQETQRMTIDVCVDERALHEIYLPAFAQAVRQAHPWTVMSAYNQVNGVYCSENAHLLTELLREQWGFDGIVITDWGANNDRLAGLVAGQDLEMPGGVGDNDRRIAQAVRQGILDEAVLDRAVVRQLRLIERVHASRSSLTPVDYEAHHGLAYKAAIQSTVLLKNTDDLLPLYVPGKLVIIGSLAERMRYQGNGSSLVNPIRLDYPLEILRERGIAFRYAAGYRRTTEKTDKRLLAEAGALAKDAETVVLFVGLTELAESEGFDRQHMRLPANQNALIHHLGQITPNIIVVLCGGAPVELPWIDQVKALLYMALPGQAGGRAIWDLLLGEANPSGKLAETYPLHYEDTASAKWFPGNRNTVEYRESLFVGYRYFDTAHQEVRFPFGHGLSYTQFAYDDLALSTATLQADEALQVAVTITNTGECVGAEIVQVYVHPVAPTIIAAEKTLQGFVKVRLQPGESTRVSVTLDRHAFAQYRVARHDWVVERGAYDIQVGASSRDLRLCGRVEVEALYDGRPAEAPDVSAAYAHLVENHGAISDAAFAALSGTPVPQPPTHRRRSYTVNSTLADIKHTLFGRLLYRVTMRSAVRMVVDADPERQLAARQMIARTMSQIPLRGLAASSGGSLTHGMVTAFALFANGRFFRGLRQLLRSLPPKHPQIP